MLQAFPQNTFKKPCPSIHCNFAPPWHSSSKALGQDMAFSATLTMVLKVTRSGCSGLECIEDLPKNPGKTRRTWEKRQVEKKTQFFKMTTCCEAREKWGCFFEERNDNFTHKMSKELETKLVRLFKNYMNHNQIASKAQQFNCSRPRTCFPKDGSPEQLQQPSWSYDLAFGVAFKRIDISVAHGDHRYHCDLLSWSRKPKFLHGTEGAIETHHIHLGTCQAKQWHQASWKKSPLPDPATVMNAPIREPKVDMFSSRSTYDTSVQSMLNGKETWKLSRSGIAECWNKTGLLDLWPFVARF